MALPPNAVLVPDCRFVYFENSIFIPAKDMNGNMKYVLDVLIPKSHDKTAVVSAIFAAQNDGLARHWKGNIPGDLHIPMKDGDAYAAKKPDKREHYKGMWYIRAKQDPQRGKPVVVGLDGMQTDKVDAVHSGDWGAIVLEFFPYSKKGNGISCSPKIIRKLRNGEPLGGSRVSLDDAMAAIGVDPTMSAGGLGGDINDLLGADPMADLTGSQGEDPLAALL